VTASEFPVEAGHIMMFGRAVGDTNPVYQDPVAATESEVGGVVAPPTFVQASAHYDPDYPLRPKPGEAWFGSGRTPTGRPPSSGGGGGDGGTGLHAEQHFTYHLPLRPGDVLTVTTRPGNRWEKQGRKGGTLRFSETITEYRNQEGHLAVTARMVGVRTGRPVKE
jgi:hypothetical protein